MNWKNITFSLIVLLCSINITANESDSLLAQYQNKKTAPNGRAKALATAISTNYSLNQPDSGIILSKELLRFSIKHNLPNWRAEANRLMGLSFQIKGEFELAIGYLRKGLTLYEGTKDSIGITDCRNTLGNIFNYIGKYDDAMLHFKKALTINQLRQDTVRTVISMVNLGVILKSQNEYDLALDYFKRSKIISEDLGNIHFLIAIYNNLGTTNQELNNPDSALLYLMKCDSLLSVRPNSPRIAALWGNLSNVYFDLNQENLALEYLQKSLALSTKFNDHLNMAIVLNRFAQYYHEQQDYVLAKNYALKGYNICKTRNLLSRLLHSSSTLSQIYLDLGDYKNAYQLKQEYAHTDELMNSKELTQVVANTIVQNTLEKKAFLAERQKQKEEKTKKEALNRRNSLKISIIVMGIISLFGGLFFLAKFQVPTWLIELVVFLLILILFEFLLVLTDPYIDQITKQVPWQKFLINTVLGGIIFPLHAVLERLLKFRLNLNSKSYDT